MKQKLTEIQIQTAIQLLREFVEVHDEGCHYDHHGYCQAHYLQDKGECMVERGKKLLEEIDYARTC